MCRLKHVVLFREHDLLPEALSNAYGGGGGGRGGRNQGCHHMLTLGHRKPKQ